MKVVLERQPFPRDGGSPKVKSTTSRPRRLRRVRGLRPAPAEAPRPESFHSTAEEEIRRRAYEIFLERGAAPGHELSDWLQAECELRKSQALSWRMASARL
jgi:hypothetical protein